MIHYLEEQDKHVSRCWWLDSCVTLGSDNALNTLWRPFPIQRLSAMLQGLLITYSAQCLENISLFSFLFNKYLWMPVALLTLWWAITQIVSYDLCPWEKICTCKHTIIQWNIWFSTELNGSTAVPGNVCWRQWTAQKYEYWSKGVSSATWHPVSVYIKGTKTKREHRENAVTEFSMWKG